MRQQAERAIKVLKVENQLEHTTQTRNSFSERLKPAHKALGVVGAALYLPFKVVEPQRHPRLHLRHSVPGIFLEAEQLASQTFDLCLICAAKNDPSDDDRLRNAHGVFLLLSS